MRLGTRGSPLALAQARLVAARLGAEQEVQIVPLTTSGDRGRTQEDKSRWVKELELALLREEIDLAVHSAKDVPAELPEGLALLGVPERADPRDALCGAASLEELPAGARVGTSSLRRCAQLRARREDLEIVALRGNVDTRLGKLAAGANGHAAIVLAHAGLARLGREEEAGALLDLVPAPGQGTLVLEGRAGDERASRAAGALSDPTAAACLSAERALVRELEASCHTPLGALAVPVADEDALLLTAWVGLPDGSVWAADERRGVASDPEALGREVGRRLRAAGAEEILAEAESLGARGGGGPPGARPEGLPVAPAAGSARA